MKQSSQDKVLIVAGGITVYEALTAQETLAAGGVHVAVIDVFSIKPIDQKLLVEQAKRVGGSVITVEDHYPEGGIGEAVQSALAHLVDVRVSKLSVNELPRSGKPADCIDSAGISAKHIVIAVKSFL